jgi:alpha-glucosidase
MTARLRRIGVQLALISLVIPWGRGGAQQTAYTWVGNVGSYERVPGGVMMHGAHGAVMVQLVAGVGVRVRMRFGDNVGAFPAPHSIATGDAEPKLGSAVVREDRGDIVVTGEGLVVRATRNPYRLTVDDASGRQLMREAVGGGSWNGRVTHIVADTAGARYTAVGEQPINLIRNGSVIPFWNTDRYGYQPGDMPIYSSFPFYIRILNGVSHGLLYDNPYRGEFDFVGRVRNTVAYTAEGALDGGELRYYVIPGPGLDSLLARYSRLTGRTEMPPRWALGYQQSRYSYHPDTMVTNLATEFRKRDIPADAIYLDIHYMDEYRVFTFSPTEFAHPKQLTDSLKALGFKVVTIIDPGVKVDSNYGVFQRGTAKHAWVTMPDGSPYIGKVWPGESAFPDFSRADVRSWWGDEQQVLFDAGVRGVWNDMNEPSSFRALTMSDIAHFDGDGHPGTHHEYHNQYGTLMPRATYEGFRKHLPDHRPLVITRAGYPGVQRYSSIWTGDNTASWDHLKLTTPMLLGLGLSGVPFTGTDLGGFIGDPSAELYSRWLQAAVLHPFYRTHAAFGTARREPWSYGPEYERANRATIRLRYRMLPSLYSAFYQHTQTGTPVVKPVFWSAASDTMALGIQNEYLMGDNLLVAPVLDSAMQSRPVYLPAGQWFRVGSNESVAGGAVVTATAPNVLQDGGDTTALKGLPIYARAGGVIPMQRPMLYDGARALDTLELHVYPGSATSILYEDAGDGYAYQRGESRVTTMRTTNGAKGLSVALSRVGSYAGARAFVVTVHGVDKPKRTNADGKSVANVYDAARREVRFTVPATVRAIDVTR